MKKIYGWLVIGVFGLMLLFVTLPSFLFVVILSLLFGETRSAQRKNVSYLCQFWGVGFWEFMKLFLRMRVEFDGDTVVPKTPYIVISNHRTALDHVFVSIAASRVGIYDIRWVLKRAMLRAPVIGWAHWFIGSAFLSRSHDPEDFDRLHRTAELVEEQDASVMIYPEGTRFKGVPAPNARFSRVLEFKLPGFKQFVTDLPNHRVLSLTLDWGRFEHGITFTHVGEFVGRTVRVCVRDKGVTTPDQAQDLLNECWIDHERYLRQGQDSLA